MDLELEWKGWYGLNIETPEDKEGLHGLFVYLYDSKIVYIGRSSGKYHLFQESKRRYKALNKALIELNVLKEVVTRTVMDKIVEEHCKKYVGILCDESKLAYLDSAEKLLIYSKSPEGNTQLKEKYTGAKPFKLINKGQKTILETLGLANYYEIY
jgi:hypothetical protein